MAFSTFKSDEFMTFTQTSTKSFSLGLGTDTAKNSSLTLHDFQRLGVRIDLPQTILGHVKPVVVSFVWFKEGHYLEPTQLNGVPKLPSLLHPCKYALLFIGFLQVILETNFLVSKGDPIYDHVLESMRILHDGTNSHHLPGEGPDEESGAVTSDQLDFGKFLLVMGIMQIQLLQLPIQPRRFADWTVVPRKTYY